jgi:hypothetical protein
MGILTSLHGRLVGLNGRGKLCAPNGYVSHPASVEEMACGSGFSGGVGAVYKVSTFRDGDIIRTRILLDLTGLASIATDGDIIGVGANPAHIGQFLTVRGGTPFAAKMTCLEVPAGGLADIDVYMATEGTGILDGAIGSLTETQLLAQGGAWTLALVKAFADPAALGDKYLYLTAGASSGAGTYTAGKFEIEILGLPPANP